MVLFHLNRGDWWLCKNNYSRTNWVSLGGIYIHVYTLAAETERNSNLTMLPIACITFNPIFYLCPRPARIIHRAALRHRTKPVQPHPVGRHCSGKTGPQDHMRNLQMKQSSKSQAGITHEGGHTHPGFLGAQDFLVKQKQLAKDNPSQSESDWTQMPARQGSVQCHALS